MNFTKLFIYVITLCLSFPALSASSFEELLERAEQGDAKAQLELGNRYETVKSYQEAIFWWEKAAELGLAEAMYYLGVIYYDNQDYEKTNMWLKKALRAGSGDAAAFLAHAHGTGQVFGFHQSYTLGYVYANLAILLGTPNTRVQKEEKTFFGNTRKSNITMREFRDILEDKLIDAKQITKAQQKFKTEWEKIQNILIDKS